MKNKSILIVGIIVGALICGTQFPSLTNKLAGLKLSKTEINKNLTAKPLKSSVPYKRKYKKIKSFI